MDGLVNALIQHTVTLMNASSGVENLCGKFSLVIIVCLANDAVKQQYTTIMEATDQLTCMFAMSAVHVQAAPGMQQQGSSPASCSPGHSQDKKPAYTGSPTAHKTSGMPSTLQATPVAGGHVTFVLPVTPTSTRIQVSINYETHARRSYNQ
jgi:hypothetical protein